MLKRWIMVVGVAGALVMASLWISDVALAKGGPGGARGAVGNRSGVGVAPSAVGNRSGVGVAPSAGGGYRSGAGESRGGYTSSTLDPQEEQALRMAIDDEYKALATYLGVMDAFGEVTPFTAIARAEQQHIAALERVFARYGITVPENEWIGNTPTFDSIAEACAAGVEAEIDNAALYDQLFSMVDNPDVLRVFTNLRNASETKHLPAFSNCSE